MTITREMLAGYLDDALSAEDTARVEQELRASEPLRNQLQQLLGERDRGEHSVGAIWRRHRLTCMSRAQLGSFLLGVLEPEMNDFVHFHLETIGCSYCQANLADLKGKQQEEAPKVQQRRRRYFDSSVKILRQ